MSLLVAIIVCLGLAALLFSQRRKHSSQSALRSIAEDSHVNESMPAAEEQIADEVSVEELPAEEITAEELHESEPTPVEEFKPEAKEADEKTDKKNDEKTDDDAKTVTQNAELIAGLHHVFEEEKVFLRPDIHIDDVAKMLLTNRTYVTRLMRQEYGLSFIEYVNIARIQHSQSLLYTTHMTLDEVAERSGFQSTSNYCRAFKRYIGTSPLAWKNSLPQ